MKKLTIPLSLGFGVTLAYLIGQRMSTDAMAVMIGVAVGVATSVPTSLLLVALLRREQNTWRTPPLPAAQPQPQLSQPPVIVLNSGDLPARSNQLSYVPLPPAQLAADGGMHRLRIVGEEERDFRF